MCCIQPDYYLYTVQPNTVIYSLLFSYIRNTNYLQPITISPEISAFRNMNSVFFHNTKAKLLNFHY